MHQYTYMYVGDIIGWIDLTKYTKKFPIAVSNYCIF